MAHSNNDVDIGILGLDLLDCGGERFGHRGELGLLGRARQEQLVLCQ